MFEALFGEPAASLDFKWLRAVSPEGFSGFHMDNVRLVHVRLWQCKLMRVPFVASPPSRAVAVAVLSF